jgi:hypothetical protein
MRHALSGLLPRLGDVGGHGKAPQSGRGLGYPSRLSVPWWYR